MYTPNYTIEADVDKLYSLIENYRFATLVCQRKDESYDISHLPFILEKPPGIHGTLFAHVARANPLWHLFNGEKQVVVIFQGPHGYISPSWYASRAEVPTWNYAVVHAYGTPKLLPDSELANLLERLVEKYEAENPDRWRIDELSKEFFDALKLGIVGFAIEIEHLEGKFKLSQNRGIKDRKGAVAGVLRRNGPLDAELAELMKKAIDEEK